MLNNDNDQMEWLVFLECMAWGSTGVLCLIEGGIPRSYSLSYQAGAAARPGDGEFTIVQISDGRRELDVDTPLWSIYPDRSWNTDDGAQALSYLQRFGSVTVLKGYIH